MKEKLLELQKNCYVPYSKYPVSAILVCNDGHTLAGVNIENASFGATICAERVAISSAITAGYRKGDFKELHIMTKSIATPCFICRQVIEEFFTENTKIICYDQAGNYKEYLKSDLCPYPFGSSDLK